MDIRLNGRNALITGGSLGIGFAIADRFARSGGNVAIVARRADVLEQARDAIKTATRPSRWTLEMPSGGRRQRHQEQTLEILAFHLYADDVSCPD